MKFEETSANPCTTIKYRCQTLSRLTADRFLPCSQRFQATIKILPWLLSSSHKRSRSIAFQPAFVDAAIQIRDTLLEAKLDTIACIDKEAYSSWVLIAKESRDVVHTPFKGWIDLTSSSYMSSAQTFGAFGR
jgi:hypothetical protein